MGQQHSGKEPQLSLRHTRAQPADLYQQALDLLVQGRSAEALKVLRFLVSEVPHFAEAQAQLASLEQAEAQRSAHQERERQQREHKAAELFAQAQTYLAEQRLFDAETSLRTALDYSPNHGGARRVLATILYQRARQDYTHGQYFSATTALREVETLLPRFRDTPALLERIRTQQEREARQRERQRAERSRRENRLNRTAFLMVGVGVAAALLTGHALFALWLERPLPVLSVAGIVCVLGGGAGGFVGWAHFLSYLEERERVLWPFLGSVVFSAGAGAFCGLAITGITRLGWVAAVFIVLIVALSLLRS